MNKHFEILKEIFEDDGNFPSGRASVRLGGPKGNTYEVTKGDVIIIPAGVAHKNIDQSSDFKCVGAYPAGQIWDMNYGKKNERPEVDKNIKKVPLPEQDPVLGADEGLINYWK